VKRIPAETLRLDSARSKKTRPRTTLAALKPLNLGKILRPLSGSDDLLGEMLK
jgi:hypothetical protein